jgi:hypothetical protein
VTHQTGENRRARQETDSGQVVYPAVGQGVKYEFPMRSYNNGLVSKSNRQAPSCDEDILPHQFRQYTDIGALDVQINNGLAWGRMSGRIMGYANEGFLAVVVPQIPGQTRGDVAGFHKRGPSPLNFAAVWESGPGSQPSNPGGPGTVIGTQIINPMTG